MTSLLKLRYILDEFSPSLEDRPAWDTFKIRVNKIEEELCVMEKEDELRKANEKMQNAIKDGTLNLSKLVPRDRVLMKSLCIHPIVPENINIKFSIGWPAAAIKPALPEFFDDNLAMDLAQFADSQIHVSVSKYSSTGKTVYEKDHCRVEVDSSDQSTQEKALEMFPILHKVVNIRSMLQAVNKYPGWGACLPDHKWPIPEGFSIDEKVARLGSRESLFCSVLGDKFDKFSYSVYSRWELTNEYFHELINEIETKGPENFLKIMQEQETIHQTLRAYNRNFRTKDVIDSRGLLDTKKVSKLFDLEEKILKVEETRGIKRKYPDGDAFCKVCNRTLKRAYWIRHVDSLGHIDKALKLSQ